MRGAHLQAAALSLTLLLAAGSGLPDFAAAVQGKPPAAVIAEGRRWLKTADDAEARTRVYATMLEAARELPNVRQGNAVAASVLKADRQRYGGDSVMRLPGMYLAAAWYGGAGRSTDEQRLLGEAVSLLETAAGPTDARLAYPLRRLADSYIRDGRDPAVARAALDRGLGLTLGTAKDEVRERAEAFAVRGDWELRFGERSAAAAWYRTAWQKLADSSHFGPAAANAAFGEPVPLVVTVPAKPFASLRRDPDFYAPGTVEYGFTVTADGAVTDLALRRSTAPIDALPTPLERALRRAQYRPAIRDGAPRPTPGHGYAFSFAVDASQPARAIRAGPIDQRF